MPDADEAGVDAGRELLLHALLDRQGLRRRRRRAGIGGGTAAVRAVEVIAAHAVAVGRACPSHRRHRQCCRWRAFSKRGRILQRGGIRSVIPVRPTVGRGEPDDGAATLVTRLHGQVGAVRRGPDGVPTGELLLGLWESAGLNQDPAVGALARAAGLPIRLAFPPHDLHGRLQLQSGHAREAEVECHSEQAGHVGQIQDLVHEPNDRTNTLARYRPWPHVHEHLAGLPIHLAAPPQCQARELHYQQVLCRQLLTVVLVVLMIRQPRRSPGPWWLPCREAAPAARSGRAGERTGEPAEDLLRHPRQIEGQTLPHTSHLLCATAAATPAAVGCCGGP
mmetsp:Transcript_24706/g.78276  ORF Transcript_24706/g.78276 Transcript_24706/m.78276 type:complete len:335 (+) Transcript_24706:1727-2731(+)